ncbi:hypothetical protein FE257_006088 [Aspergillus nanangensis]|uniref:DUF7136 domain-containing protein n=1 Tax=Aspergillus nanangensis TaxID=2582783 RepID=A0AAD4CPN8_ASPNN|nr:hypothetical protein FE257_006088 [Aspergillus nanangensis]
MGLLQGWISLASLVWSAASSQVAEVDVIFPRANETFSPSPLTPIVFALHNPSLLSTLDPQLEWYIELLDVDIHDHDYISATGWGNLSKLNLTNVTDPYFLHLDTGHLNVEGRFMFSWKINLWNCSHNPETDEIDKHWFGTRRPEFTFSTKKRHRIARLEWSGPSCAVNPDFSPTPSCNAKMDSSAAASISAFLTSRACLAPMLYTGLSCPTPSTENAASRPQFSVTVAWVCAIALWLAYRLAYRLA